LEKWRKADHGWGERGRRFDFHFKLVGKEPNASSIAASSADAIPGIHCSVGGLEGAVSVDWYETDQLKIGDELRVRLISSDLADSPFRSQRALRGNPDWIKKARP
jgi:hypothetical protein